MESTSIQLASVWKRRITRRSSLFSLLGVSATGLAQQPAAKPDFVSSPRRQYTAPELLDAPEEWIQRSLEWCNYILDRFPPSLPEAPQRRAALIRIDDILHIESAASKPIVQAFYKRRMEAAIGEIEATKVTRGVRIWKLYNHGFLVRTPSVSFAFDIVAGIPVAGFELPGSLQTRLVQQSDAFFISHVHPDHASKDIGTLALQANKPVIAPDGLWADDSAFVGRIIYPPRSLTQAMELPVQNGTERLLVQAWPGHQGAILNNIHMVTSPEGFTALHTGDQEPQEAPGPDFDWIDQIKNRKEIDLLLVNCWTTDIQRVIRGVNPKLVLPGHENEMQHTVDHREDYTQTYNRLFGTSYPFQVLGWGESIAIQ